MSSRVFVFEPTSKDLGSASNFGKLEYMFDNDERRPSIWEVDQLLDAIDARLDELDFNPEKDFILGAGATMPLMVIMHLLCCKYVTYKVLFWHASVSEYVPRSFSSNDWTY